MKEIEFRIVKFENIDKLSIQIKGIFRYRYLMDKGEIKYFESKKEAIEYLYKDSKYKKENIKLIKHSTLKIY
jgi:hypothetical protein